MIVKKILKILEFVDDDTTVILRNKTKHTIIRGYWFSDRILDHCEDPVETFTWYEDNTVHIDLKEVCNE